MHKFLLGSLFVLIPALSQAGDPKPAVVKFDTLKTQHMTVMVKINGKGPYRVIFDTGAPVTLISNKVAKEAEVLGKNFKPSPFAIFGQTGNFKIKKLEIDELKVENVDTVVMDHPTVNMIATAVGPIEGIVGFNVFGKFRTTLDYQKKEMTFLPTDFVPPNMLDKIMRLMMASRNEREKARVLAPGGILGLRVRKDAKDEEPGVIVDEVYTDGPAAKAGMKSGDRLLTLDQRWTDTISDCFVAASRLQPGARTSAEVVRGGKKLDLKIDPFAGW